MSSGSGIFEVPTVKSILYPNVEIRDSTTHGKGLFAKRRIRKGEVVVIKGGILMSWAQVRHLRGRASTSWLQLDEDVFIGAATEAQCDDIMTCVNHTCDWDKVNIGMQDGIFGVAMRNITEGEELFYYYPLFFVHPEWTMICECGYEHCLGELNGFMWQDPRLQERFSIEWFSPYARRLINERREQADIGSLHADTNCAAATRDRRDGPWSLLPV